MASKPVVSFQESTLYEEDLDILRLRGSGWLSSNVIDFWFCHLEYTKYAGCLGDAHVLILHPATLFIIAMTEDPNELVEFLEPLQLHLQRVVFLPVNNETQRDLTGHATGTHWSLLMYERDTNRFRHFDSYNGVNNKNAHRISIKLHAVLGCVNAPPPTFEVVADAAQQLNGRDCGLYVCANVDDQIALLLNKPRMELSAANVASIRNQIYELAQKMAKTKN
jgi:sentrin-specific protease 8